ncbi:integrase catalytic domain-containing protein [Trichonephila clavipes]|nr:integrase catalytic domain-containing protein [Trichonephila clavipes]
MSRTSQDFNHPQVRAISMPVTFQANKKGYKRLKKEPLSTNRVAKMQELTVNFSWHHISSENNPKHLVSRGLSVFQMSPNFGGLWESGVKSFKTHLKRVAGSSNLTLEEFITLLAEIEAVLNSRPLSPLSSDFDDFETLSPGHFLIGRPVTAIVEPQLINAKENRLTRWQRVNWLSQQI